MGYLDEYEETEIDSSVAEAFDDLGMEFDEKIRGIAHVISKKKADISHIKSETDRLKALQKRAERDIKFLEYYSIMNIEAVGKKKIEFSDLRVSIRESRAVEIEGELNDPTYLVETTTVRPDKKAIKEAIQAGETVAGAYLKINKSLNIK